MKEGWKKVRLGDVAVFRTGKLNSNAAVTGGAYPFFTCSPETYAINEYAFDENAILLAGNNANGIFSLKYYRGKFNAYQRTYVITSKTPDLDLNFLYYLLNLKINYFREISQGSATKFLTTTILNQIELTLPPLEEQRRIASILTALDDKIELNRRMNETLEGIAGALWEEWFGKYVRDGEELPEGWRWGKLSELVHILGGGTPKTDTDEYWGGEINWISGKDITPNHKSIIIQTEKKITKIGLDNSSAKLLPAFSTVVSARGTVGNYCLIPEPMTISQSNYALKSRFEKTDFYLFQQVANIIQDMQQKSYGTVFDTITTKTFDEIDILIPDETKMKQYDETIHPIFIKRISNLYEIKKIEAVRNLLITNLLS